MKNKKITLRGMLENKKIVMTISLVLSFAVWLTVMIKRNPVRQQVFSDIPVNVSIENTTVSELGLGIISDVSAQKFTVTLNGPNYVVSSLKPDDFTLSASLENINSAGTYKLAVIAAKKNEKKEYTFASISPSTIDVTFDYIDVKEFSVTPKLIGVGAVKGLVADTPSFTSPEQQNITVKGPRSVLNRINDVSALVNVDKVLDSTQTYDADIAFYDKKDKIIYRYSVDGKIYNENGNEVENTNLTLSYTSAKVLQPISKKKVLPLNIVFDNRPSGLKDSSFKYSIDMNKVTVIGTPDVVDKLKSVSLTPIDFFKISKSKNKFKVSATLPDGVRLLDNIDKFTVRINSSLFSEKTFDVSSTKFIGIDKKSRPSVLGKIKNVKICGPKYIIDNAKASDFYAQLDLTDKSKGEHNIEAVIKYSKSDAVWQVGEYTATVSVK